MPTTTSKSTSRLSKLLPVSLRPTVISSNRRCDTCGGYLMLIGLYEDEKHLLCPNQCKQDQIIHEEE